MNRKKRLLTIVLLCTILFSCIRIPVMAESPAAVEISAESAILMEATTGTVIFEKNADQELSPASITKIMTLLLIFEALEEGKIQLTDEVVTSAYAKSMGGSQVFLEEGEIQSVETMIKCIVIASGNDASVAMAEHIAGSEESFVQQMNQKAEALGMKQTKFEDCCGLTDSATHVSSARDVAVMSRELVTRFPEIYEYTTIWMENITHVTKQGAKEFCLSNTNKLLKTYEGAKGLKTGSTSLAKYCLSATAIRNDIHLIAVIMAAPDYKARFGEAEKLLNYGYANCSLYTDSLEDITIPEVSVNGSIQKTVGGSCEKEFRYLCLNGENTNAILREIQMEEALDAPVKEGQKIGQITYMLDNKTIGTIPVIAKESIDKAGFKDYLFLIIEKFNRLMI